MPARTALSHAAAAFVSLVLSATLGTYIEQYELVETLTRLVGHAVSDATDGSVAASYGGPLVVTTCLSFLWGIVYHWHRFGGPDGS